MRNRTRMRSSSGSMWMSLARSRMPWAISRLAICTIGASSSLSASRAATAVVSCSVGRGDRPGQRVDLDVGPEQPIDGVHPVDARWRRGSGPAPASLPARRAGMRPTDRRSRRRCRRCPCEYGSAAANGSAPRRASPIASSSGVTWRRSTSGKLVERRPRPAERGLLVALLDEGIDERRLVERLAGEGRRQLGRRRRLVGDEQLARARPGARVRIDLGRPAQRPSLPSVPATQFALPSRCPSAFRLRAHRAQARTD